MVTASTELERSCFAGRLCSWLQSYAANGDIAPNGELGSSLYAVVSVWAKIRRVSDTKSGNGKRRSAAIGGWVLLGRIVVSSAVRLPGPSIACDVACGLRTGLYVFVTSWLWFLVHKLLSGVVGGGGSWKIMEVLRMPVIDPSSGSFLSCGRVPIRFPSSGNFYDPYVSLSPCVRPCHRTGKSNPDTWLRSEMKANGTASDGTRLCAWGMFWI